MIEKSFGNEQSLSECDIQTCDRVSHRGQRWTGQTCRHVLCDAIEELVHVRRAVGVLDDGDDGPAVLAVVGRLDLCTVEVAELLEAVTDAKHRDTCLEHSRINSRCIRVVDRVRRAREDDAWSGLES